nr:DUF6465 family protein [uncultured Butyrivibrio sp.]
MAKAKKTNTKATANKAANAATKLVETVAKKAEEAKSKKASAKKAEATTDVKANVVLQYADKDLSYDELVQNAKNVLKYDMNGDPETVKKIDLFVKPEDNKVYFVMDGVEGSYDL